MTLRKWLKQLFCHHDWIQLPPISAPIQLYWNDLICSKCDATDLKRTAQKNRYDRQQAALHRYALRQQGVNIETGTLSILGDK